MDDDYGGGGGGDIDDDDDGDDDDDDSYYHYHLYCYHLHNWYHSPHLLLSPHVYIIHVLYWAIIGLVAKPHFKIIWMKKVDCYILVYSVNQMIKY